MCAYVRYVCVCIMCVYVPFDSCSPQCLCSKQNKVNSNTFSELTIYLNASRISELLVLAPADSLTLFLTIWGG
jgi:hypothetical protein